MSNAGLGLRDAPAAMGEDLPRTHARRAAAEAQARARSAKHGRPVAVEAPFDQASFDRASFDEASFDEASFDRSASERPAAGHHRGPRVASDHAPRAHSPLAYGSRSDRVGADNVRTVKIRGQATPPRRRPLIDTTRSARYDQHPDRAAQWALFLGVFMVVVAIVTGS